VAAGGGRSLLEDVRSMEGLGDCMPVLQKQRTELKNRLCIAEHLWVEVVGLRLGCFADEN
jgi:hypothetical protein